MSFISKLKSLAGVIPALVLLLASYAGTSTPAQAQQRVNEGCSAFYPCGQGLSCIPFRQVCRRNSGGLEGEACQAGYGCASGFTCEAGTQVCRGPAKSGETCHLTKPCGPGLSCQPGVHRCYAVPRAEGEPCSAGFGCGSGLQCEAGSQVCRAPGKAGESCHATRPCGGGLTCEAGTQRCRAPSNVGEACHATRPCSDGLTCEAGTQTCRAPSQVGEACHATRPCGTGLSCQPGVHKCYHSPRQMCEPCSAGYGCASGLSCQAGTRKVKADWQVGFEDLGNEILRSCRGPSGYQVKVTWAPSPPGVKEPSAFVKEKMQAAVDRWRTIIQGSLPNPTTTVTADMRQSGLVPDWMKPMVAIGSTWTDLHIVVRIAGQNQHPEGFAPTSKTLAHAAESYSDPAHKMPRLGFVEINELTMESNIAGYTEMVLMHEIGHILGFNEAMFTRKNLLSTDRRSFTGRNALAAWRARGHSGNIPLEWVDDKKDLKPGGHWAGSVVNGDLESELMRPEAGHLWGIGIISTMYPTRLTTGALQDFGYTLVSCEGTPQRMSSPPVVTTAPPVSPPNSARLGGILWQHQSGQVHYWKMSNGQRLDGINIHSPVGADWKLIGAGDVDGDGSADLVWQHQSGQVHYWKMQGRNRVSGTDIFTPVGKDWRLIGVQDLDGDGTADLLWQHQSGQVHYWKMRGGKVAAPGINIHSPVPADWRLIGAGDVDGDGVADIVWQHQSGQVHYWRMQGGSHAAGIDIHTPVGADWRLIGAGDFNGDGTADLLWQHRSGQTHYWAMRGGKRVEGIDIFTPVGSDWRAIGAGRID